MPQTRRRYSAKEKAAIALEAIREHKTITELSQKFRVHPTQIGQWKARALQGLPQVFERAGAQQDQEQLIAQLYEQLGRVQTELAWMKKKFQTFHLKSNAAS